jgi:hypothetical protein
MNERIKLPAQEWLGYDPEKGDIHGYTFEQMSDVAESIILDCLTICDEVQWQYGQYTFTATTVKNRVIEHFGVKE